MGPSRVFAVPPGGSKRLLEVEESAPTRVTRSKAANVSNHEEILQHNDRESSQQMDDMQQPLGEERNMSLQLSPVTTRAHQLSPVTTRALQLSPVTTRARSQPALSEQTEQPVYGDNDAEDHADADDDEGKFVL
jgi:hypothetical protein